MDDNPPVKNRGMATTFIYLSYRFKQAHPLQPTA